jgi:hypothetical protein
MSALLELQQEILFFALLVVFLSVAPGVTGDGGPSGPSGPSREPGWKKYLKYLGWLLLATLLGFVFLYAVGDAAGDDPPGSPPWTPAGLPTELFDRRAGWTPAEWSAGFVGTTDQEVYDEIARFIELKSHRVLKPEVVHRLGSILHIPLTDRQDLPWYIRQRMIETAPAETARAVGVARESLIDLFSHQDALRHGMAAVEKRHGTRLYEFALEYKQKR